MQYNVGTEITILLLTISERINLVRRQRFNPCRLNLCVNDFCVHDLPGTRPDVIHSTNPLHSVFGLELFGDSLGLLHLLYQDFHSFLCLLINFGKIAVQLAAGQQLRVDDLPVLLQVAPVPLPPEPNRLVFTLRQGQAGKVLVSLQLVPKAVAFIVLVLVHSKILQYNIFTHMPQAADCHTLL